MPPKKPAAAKTPEETVPVAEQKAAGVPDDETVTIAEQKAGEPLPESISGDVVPAPGPGAGREEPFPVEPLEQAQTEGDPDVHPSVRSGRATSNESPTLPPNAQSGAARAHAMLDQALAAADGDDLEKAFAIIKRAQDELARYIPGDLRGAGAAEAAHVVATEI